MKAPEVRALSTKEVEERIREEEEQLSELKFRHAIAQLENPLLLREKRRFLARLRTILKEQLG
ncbi:MAG: 50S ribosomal protein L29 [Bacteroidota bacterium]|nr:50S ribosomal protein L29 [Bacteroidota bacterium]MXW82835.1 50S ribosomal protein L29 [Rhodothermaceae bacterium]MDE2671246.1 50S ribosomal protein L29 [Bacteroidota bacterium]MDE2769672.1 50S ribosomal protein L29 [Bacteroidota bacterium]MXX58208.1 50S ribosomal protein L29 [Rhodothermaceae bacterium]